MIRRTGRGRPARTPAGESTGARIGSFAGGVGVERVRGTAGTGARLAAAALLLSSILLVAAPAVAQGGDRFAFSAGAFDVLNSTRSEELGFEYRFEPRAFELVPTVGATLNTDEGGYVLAGLRRDFRASERWVVTPHFGVTLFDQGDGKDLGHAVEFRSGLEVSYRLNDRSRLGLSFYHLSNAGLDETNPGAESLVLVYSFD